MTALRKCAIGRGLACCAGLLIAFSVCAEEGVVYRWKGEDGRVNYGNVPPPGVKAEPVSGGHVTVVPALVVPPEKVPSAADASQRLERLERELENERQLRRDAEIDAEQAAAARARRKSDCEERYREPCNDDGQPVGARIIVAPVRPPHVSPPRPGEPRGERRDDSTGRDVKDKGGNAVPKVLGGVNPAAGKGTAVGRAQAPGKGPAEETALPR